jgi:glycosyltransferase involved in cell wall biosynthesis
MISVVIPTYNEAAFIGTLLESLAWQEVGEPVEVIVADSRSRDATREIAESFRNKFAGLLIVDGGTPAVGRNRGAHVSSGDPIFFIDADLKLHDPAFLARNIKYFRLHHLAAASVRLVPQSDKWFDHFLVELYNLLLWPAIFIRPLGSMCIVADRSVFGKTGGYPEDVAMAEDHDFVLRCSRLGRYRIMPVRAHFNIRRFDKEGRLSLVIKYLRASISRVFRGPITAFEYEFGYFEEDRAHRSDGNRSRE